MKTNIKFFVIIAVLVIGFFLPFVLVALGFAFSWTIAIVAGIVCEIGVFFIFVAFVLSVGKLQNELDIANRKVELQKEAGYMYEDLYNNLVQKNKEKLK